MPRGDAPAGPGHNSEIPTAAAGQLKAFIERIERLEEERRALSGDIREVVAEAKGSGFDAAVLRKIVRLRAQDAGKRRAEAEILETYMHAIGMEV